MSYNTLVVLIGTGLLGACCGLVGTFAVLRRRALVGDALAHASLPGVCIAFMVVQERSLPWLLTGALIAGLAGTLVITLIRNGTRIKEDAAIGIVLSSFYGLGVVLLAWIQHHPTGAEKAGLSEYILGQTAGMTEQEVKFIAGCAIVCLVVVVLLFKEFKLVAFDAEFAAVQGWPAFRLDLLLMVLIAMTVVVGLPAVGVILVAASLIIPAASARFWTDHLGRTLFLSSLFGAAGAAAGSLASAFWGTPAGPAIVLSCTLIFVVSVVFAPSRGVVARMLRNARFRRRLAIQTWLLGYPEKPLTGQIRRGLNRRGWANTDTGAVKLTESGLARRASLLAAREKWLQFCDAQPELVGEYASFDLTEFAAGLGNDTPTA